LKNTQSAGGTDEIDLVEDVEQREQIGYGVSGHGKCTGDPQIDLKNMRHAGWDFRGIETELSACRRPSGGSTLVWALTSAEYRDRGDRENSSDEQYIPEDARQLARQDLAAGRELRDGIRDVALADRLHELLVL
jgi:hypothetical protein